jgi:hypothetical protein
MVNFPISSSSQHEPVKKKSLFLWSTKGLRGTPHLELWFDNVELEEIALLGDPGQGFKMAITVIAKSVMQKGATLFDMHR